MTHRFHTIAVVGAGAVGTFYGAMLSRAGHPVTLIGRAAHVQAIERDGLRLDMAGRVEVVRLSASVDLAMARGADLVLFCVKSTDTDAVATDLAPYLHSGALVHRPSSSRHATATEHSRSRGWRSSTPATRRTASRCPSSVMYSTGDLPSTRARKRPGNSAAGTDPSPVMRSYRSFSQAARENGVSRIYVGFHFREAVDEGIAHGRKIGERAVDEFMRPVK